MLTSEVEGEARVVSGNVGDIAVFGLIPKELDITRREIRLVLEDLSFREVAYFSASLAYIGTAKT